MGLYVNGTPDLLWQHVNTGQVSVWWMSGLVMQRADLMTPAQMVEAGWRLVGPR